MFKWGVEEIQMEFKCLESHIKIPSQLQTLQVLKQVHEVTVKDFQLRIMTYYKPQGSNRF